MKIGCIIPIRLASERLPGKALKMAAGKPMVCHLLDQVWATRSIRDFQDAVVCTTEDASDDPLVRVVTACGASVFRGDRDDLIKRFRDAIRARGFDAVIQVDGDDILCASEYMDATMERLLADANLDVVTVAGLPLGCAAKSFTAAAMEKVFRHYKTTQNDTGFSYFFTRTGICSHAEIAAVDPRHRHDTARLTLDYEEDLAVFRAVIDALYTDGSGFSLSDVVSYLKAHPDIAGLNLHLEEEYVRRTKEKAKLEYFDETGATRLIPI
jgi:spore coat polysaccharide biosynthesis protein SpsF (cytidylyltransferase family)